jgi:O-antigen ligase
MAGARQRSSPRPALASGALRTGKLAAAARARPPFLAIAATAPVLFAPLLMRPVLAIGGAAALVCTLLAWLSPAIPLGLIATPNLVPLTGATDLPDGAVTMALFAWLLAGIAFALLQRSHEVPMPFRSFLPALLSIALLAWMLLRLGDSRAAEYGSRKVQLFLTLNLGTLVAGMVVGRRRRDVELCLALMLLVAVVAALGTLSQILSGVRPTFEGRYGLSNVEYDPIALGRLSAVGLLIAAYAVLARTGRVRAVAMVVAPLIAIAVLASGGRGPILGLLAGLAVLAALLARGGAWKRLPLLLAAAVASALVVGQLVPGEAIDRALSVIVGGETGRDSNGRSELWAAAWRVFVEHPGMGVGTGGFAAIEPAELYPHNLFLEVGVELGLLGLAALVAALAIGIAAIGGAFRSATADDRALLGLVIAMLVAALVNAMVSADIAGNADVWLALGLGIGLSSALPTPGAGRPRRREPLPRGPIG